jgi:DNA-binding NarL/FixJ family response regulator
MAPIRILLSQLQGMLRDVVLQLLDGQADMTVVDDVDDPIDTLLAAGRTHADVVVLGMEEDELPGVASHLLDEYPHLKVLAVTPDGRRAFLYELRPELIALGEASPDVLLQAIRAAFRAEVGGMGCRR